MSDLPPGLAYRRVGVIQALRAFHVRRAFYVGTDKSGAVVIEVKPVDEFWTAERAAEFRAGLDIVRPEIVTMLHAPVRLRWDESTLSRPHGATLFEDGPNGERR